MQREQVASLHRSELDGLRERAARAGESVRRELELAASIPDSGAELHIDKSLKLLASFLQAVDSPLLDRPLAPPDVSPKT